MFNKALLVAFLAVFIAQFCGAMQDSESRENDMTVDDIPAYCVGIAKKLSEQPLFTGTGSLCKGLKVLSLNWNDCRICNILSWNSRSHLKNAWQIQEFGCWNYWLYASRNGPCLDPCLDQGVTLKIYDNHEMCSLEELEVGYKKVIEQLKSGWCISSLRGSPNIRFKKSEEEWYLFIKEECLCEEDTMIRFLADKFKLEKKIDCSDDELEEGGGGGPGDTIYLWVKKIT